MQVDVSLGAGARELIWQALCEDMPAGDVTTGAIVSDKAQGEVDLIGKQDGVIAGLAVFAYTFELLDKEAVFETRYCDGDRVEKGQVVGTARASVCALLSGERSALNFLQRMSGIATATRNMVDLLAETGIALVDTRKTTPNMRIFEKYAVTVGGGINHRQNLSDGILIKDNHIGAAGSITRAVELVRKNASFVRKIEVETETIAMVQEALDASVDIIMLDNMSVEMMAEAVVLIDGRAKIECSGNVTPAEVSRLADLGIDYLSVGALTHSSPIVDFSLKNLRIR